jgi:replication-associated recombination protein RarA
LFTDSPIESRMSAPTLPADFNEFLGNTHAVESLRTAIAAGRLPHAIILSGPAGAGKYTLALLLTMTIECERQPRDLWSNGQTLAGFCGHCANCTRIASAANLEEQVAAAVAAREELRETDKKETRILVQIRRNCSSNWVRSGRSSSAPTICPLNRPAGSSSSPPRT